MSLFGFGKKHIFISFDYSTGLKYKNLLQAWNKNDMFDFDFNNQSVSTSVNSTNAGAIKRVISNKINKSTHFLCIVSKDTHKSDWVKWEIEKAIEFNIKIIAVKINKSNNTPSALYGVGASWTMSFTFVSIKNAINKN
jgi:hypothetical protein